MVGTPQVSWTYDMEGYKLRSKHDAVEHKASYT
jgi:hypothetical protein